MNRFANIKILYIEDDRALAHLFKKRLEKLEYSVETAVNGTKGLEMFQEDSFDLLVVDYHLPDTNGLEIVRTLAAEGDLPPTIMLTGTGNEAIAVEAIKWGVSDYIVKEANYLELMPSVIEQVMQQNDLINTKATIERALIEAETTNMALLDAIPDLLIHLDVDNNIVDVRQPAGQIPPTANLEIGNHIKECLQKETALKTIMALDETRKSRSLQQFQFHCKVKGDMQYYENRIIASGKDSALMIIRNITEQEALKRDREALIDELQSAVSKIKTLSGLIPICSCCKRIRDDGGYWNSLELYLQQHSDMAFSHSYCPSCIQEEFPELYEENKFK